MKWAMPCMYVRLSFQRLKIKTRSIGEYMENCCSLTRLGEHCDAMGCQGITLVTCIGSGPELREEEALLISSHGLAGVVLEYWAVNSTQNLMTISNTSCV